MKHNMGRPSNKGFMPNIAGIITCILVGIVLTLLLTKIMMLEMFSEKLLKHLLMVAHAIAAWIGSVVCVAVGKSRDLKRVGVVGAAYILLVSLFGLLFGGLSLLKMIFVIIVTLLGSSVTFLLPVKRTKSVRFR